MEEIRGPTTRMEPPRAASASRAAAQDSRHPWFLVILATFLGLTALVLWLHDSPNVAGLWTRSRFWCWPWPLTAEAASRRTMT